MYDTNPPQAPLSELERESLGQLTASLHALRALDDSGLIISFGSHGPSYDSKVGHMSVTITRDGETATAEAVHLHDAILLARAKVSRQIETEKKRREDARAQSRATQSEGGIK